MMTASLQGVAAQETEMPTVGMLKWMIVQEIQRKMIVGWKRMEADSLAWK
jgi:hypothetical protein